LASFSDLAEIAGYQKENETSAIATANPSLAKATMLESVIKPPVAVLQLSTSSDPVVASKEHIVETATATATATSQKHTAPQTAPSPQASIYVELPKSGAIHQSQNDHAQEPNAVYAQQQGGAPNMAAPTSIPPVYPQYIPHQPQPQAMPYVMYPPSQPYVAPYANPMYQSFPTAGGFGYYPPPPMVGPGMGMFRHSFASTSAMGLGFGVGFNQPQPQPSNDQMLELYKQLLDAKEEANQANKRLAELLLEMQRKETMSGVKSVNMKPNIQDDDDENEYSYSFEDDEDAIPSKNTASAVKTAAPLLKREEPSVKPRSSVHKVPVSSGSSSSNHSWGTPQVTLADLRASLDKLRDQSGVASGTVPFIVPPQTFFDPNFKQLIANSQAIYQVQLKSLRERLQEANASYRSSLTNVAPMASKQAFGFDFKDVEGDTSSRMGSARCSSNLSTTAVL
jgi:hypothetical protein